MIRLRVDASEDGREGFSHEHSDGAAVVTVEVREVAGADSEFSDAAMVAFQQRDSLPSQFRIAAVDAAKSEEADEHAVHAAIIIPVIADAVAGPASESADVHAPANQ